MTLYAPLNHFFPRLHARGAPPRRPVRARHFRLLEARSIPRQHHRKFRPCGCLHSCGTVRYRGHRDHRPIHRRTRRHLRLPAGRPFAEIPVGRPPEKRRHQMGRRRSPRQHHRQRTVIELPRLRALEQIARRQHSHSRARGYPSFRRNRIESGLCKARLRLFQCRGILLIHAAKHSSHASRRAAGPNEYVVPAGTHILLRLTNSVNTKSTVTGDRIYLETAVPVFINGRLIIPQGSYVNGRVADAKSSGRVKGKAELALEYDSITLRTTGISRDLRSRPDSVDTVGNLNKSEGKIESESSKGEDAGRVARTTAVGAGAGTMIGAAAGHVGAGAGLGAAGGAVAGLASVFGSRGKQVVLPAGTTMDMTLDRD